MSLSFQVFHLYPFVYFIVVHIGSVVNLGSVCLQSFYHINTTSASIFPQSFHYFVLTVFSRLNSMAFISNLALYVDPAFSFHCMFLVLSLLAKVFVYHFGQPYI